MPRLTRTPRKRPAGWAQLELNLLDAPDYCIIISSRIYVHWFIFLCFSTEQAVVCEYVCVSNVCAPKTKQHDLNF